MAGIQEFYDSIDWQELQAQDEYQKEMELYEMEEWYRQQDSEVEKNA